MNLFYNFLEKYSEKYLSILLKIYWSVLFILTTIPGDHLPKTIKVSDKIEHFVAYFILALLLGFYLHFNKSFGKKKILFWGILLISLYAGFDEIHQMFIPMRSAEWLDFIADFFGAVLGTILVLFIITRKVLLKNK